MKIFSHCSVACLVKRSERLEIIYLCKSFERLTSSLLLIAMERGMPFLNSCLCSNKMWNGTRILLLTFNKPIKMQTQYVISFNSISSLIGVLHTLWILDSYRAKTSIACQSRDPTIPSEIVHGRPNIYHRGSLCLSNSLTFFPKLPRCILVRQTRVFSGHTSHLDCTCTYCKKLCVNSTQKLE
jgi:hypothetical protein